MSFKLYPRKEDCSTFLASAPIPFLGSQFPVTRYSIVISIAGLSSTRDKLQIFFRHKMAVTMVSSLGGGRGQVCSVRGQCLSRRQSTGSVKESAQNR